MMCYKLIVFYFIFAAVRARSDGDERPHNPCIDLLMPPVFKQFCCKSLGTLEDVMQKALKTECKLEHWSPWTCKDSTCVIVKGLLETGKVSESKINATLVKARNTKDYPELKNMTDMIRASGPNGKYKMYPTPGCEPMQSNMCTYICALKECGSWKDSDECKTVSVTAAKCKAIFDKAIKQH